MNLLMIFVGGGLGALARYGVCALGAGREDKFWFTMAVNIIGSLLIGVMWSLINSTTIPRAWSALTITGFLGGFTTFSTFAYEAVTLMESGRWCIALLYTGISLVCGIGACAVGLWLTDNVKNIFA